MGFCHTFYQLLWSEILRLAILQFISYFDQLCISNKICVQKAREDRVYCHRRTRTLPNGHIWETRHHWIFSFFFFPFFSLHFKAHCVILAAFTSRETKALHFGGLVIAIQHAKYHIITLKYNQRHIYSKNGQIMSQCKTNVLELSQPERWCISPSELNQVALHSLPPSLYPSSHSSAAPPVWTEDGWMDGGREGRREQNGCMCGGVGR